MKLNLTHLKEVGNLVKVLWYLHTKATRLHYKREQHERKAYPKKSRLPWDYITNLPFADLSDLLPGRGQRHVTGLNGIVQDWSLSMHSLGMAAMKKLRRLGWELAGMGADRVAVINGSLKLAVKFGVATANQGEWLFYHNCTPELQQYMAEPYYLGCQGRLLVQELVRVNDKRKTSPNRELRAKMVPFEFVDAHDGNYGISIRSDKSVMLDYGHQTLHLRGEKKRRFQMAVAEYATALSQKL